MYFAGWAIRNVLRSATFFHVPCFVSTLMIAFTTFGPAFPCEHPPPARTAYKLPLRNVTSATPSISPIGDNEEGNPDTTVLTLPLRSIFEIRAVAPPLY